MYFYIKTLGCKLNRYDSDQLSANLQKNTWQEVDNPNEADFLIINSCTVTNSADHKSRQAVTHLKKENPHAKVIVMGCGTESDQSQFQTVDLVSNDQIEIVKYIQNCDFKIKKSISPEKENFTLDFENSKYSRTRANIKIQTGCDNYCSYCIIPFTRGNSVSLNQEEIIQEIQTKEKEGYQEIVITGINIGAYGSPLTTQPQKNKLAELLENILEKTKIPRIRLSSIGPQYFTSRLIEVLQNPRVCQHLHLSIQSGSNTVLKRMNRTYQIEEVIALIEKLRNLMPDIAFNSDIIVGFPEETEEEFLETLSNLFKISLMKTHIFPYSIRKKTIAAKMQQVPNKIKIERKKVLTELADQMTLNFINEQIGKEKKVLFEQKNKNGLWEGYTDNYIRIQIKSEESLENKIKLILLTKENIIFKNKEIL